MDGQLVTQQKLILFLQKEVLSRGLRNSRWSRKRETRDGKDIVQTLAYSTVEGYVSAIVNLWRYQVACGDNHHPNPCGPLLQAILEDRSFKEDVWRKAEYVDRGANTMQDGYAEREMIDVVRKCWTAWRSKQQTANAVEPYHRTAVDFLFSHSMLMRGENLRFLEFPDLFVLPLKNEGPTPCNAMILILSNGKMNQHGRIEYASVVRHKNPLLCCMSQLAFYLFYRWNVKQEEPPKFQQRQQWYNFKVMRGKVLTKSLSYEVQLEWIRRVFTEANVKSLKKTHAGRKQGAQHAETAGVSEAAIRRAGRWNHDAMSTCYLSNLPLEFVRSMAGFTPLAGNFYLPRAKVQPPPSLIDAVWPWVDQWLAWLKAHTGPSEVGREDGLGGVAAAAYEDLPLQDLPSDKEDPTDIAAQGFLQLLKELRVILLQDSVIMRTEFPDHPIWNDPLFGRADYAEFAAGVHLSLEDIALPDEVRLRNVLPDLATTFVSQSANIVRTTETCWNQNFTLLQHIQATLDGLFGGPLTATVNLHKPANIPAQPQFLRTMPLQSSLPAAASASTLLPAAELMQDVPTLPATAPLDPDASPPAYLMSRSLTTVYDAWREWADGLGSNPSVHALEDAYGPAWRPLQKERQHFSRRKVIWDEIERQVAAGGSAEVAVRDLELVRQRHKLCLTGLSTWLKKGKGKA